MINETFASHSRAQHVEGYRPQFQSEPERVKRLQAEVERERIAKSVIAQYGLKVKKHDKTLWMAYGYRDCAYGSTRTDAVLNYQLMVMEREA